MRHYIKSFLITIASVYTTLNLIPALSWGTDPKNPAVLIAGFWVINLVINPIFSLVFLPINLLTFGLISAILNTAFLFALINFLPGFHISAYTFAGAEVRGVVFPSFYLNMVETTVAIALSITIIQKILHIIFE